VYVFISEFPHAVRDVHKREAVIKSPSTKERLFVIYFLIPYPLIVVSN